MSFVCVYVCDSACVQFLSVSEWGRGRPAGLFALPGNRHRLGVLVVVVRGSELCVLETALLTTSIPESIHTLRAHKTSAETTTKKGKE